MLIFLQFCLTVPRAPPLATCELLVNRHNGSVLEALTTPCTGLCTGARKIRLESSLLASPDQPGLGMLKQATYAPARGLRFGPGHGEDPGQLQEARA